MNHLDLFSGIGGFSLAAQWAGIDTIIFCEKDKFCQKVLAKNFPGVPIHDDVKTFSWNEKVDLLTAGFPCQPFSCAGNKKGVKDDRYLWPEVFRIIKLCRPTWVILENVPGIIPMLDPILSDLEGEAYFWQAFLIPASSIGAPHKRERIWIIANATSVRCDNGCSNRQRRHIQDNQEQYLKKIQQEWSQFIPKSWATFNAQEWLGLTSNTNSLTNNKANTPSLTEKNRESRIEYKRTIGADKSIFNWQESESPICGVDDGLPNIVDRNRALGNAIVPQLAYSFMRIIKLLHDKHI